MIRKNLSRQIFVYFFIVIFFSLTVVGVFTYIESSKEIDRQVEKYISQVIQTALNQTEVYLARYEQISNSILTEKDVKLFIELDPSDHYRRYELYERIKRIFQRTFIAHPNIHMLYVINDHGQIVIDDNENLVSYPQMDVPRRLQYLNEISPVNGAVAVSKTGIVQGGVQEVITLSRRIRGYSNYVPQGILAIEVKTDELAGVWDVIDLGDGALFFIVDKEGELVYRSDRGSEIFTYSRSFRNRIFEQQSDSFTETIHGEPYLFVSRESDYVGWKLYIALPMRELRSPIETIRSTTVIVGGVTLVLALLLAYRFGGSIVRPIRILKEGMRETEKGNWKQIQLDENRQDEIGGLVHSYNLMVSRLSEMIERVYEAELENQKSALAINRIRLARQKAEFEALQMQINPHYLYNTLETINCYAIVKDSPEISEIVESLSFMLRYSVQTNLEEITVANELNHVRHYMTILKHRIGREFEIDVVIPPEYLLKKMVRLTLQPLVENVFQHAFADGVEAHHRIMIDALVEGDRFYVIVEDNGRGIPEDQLSRIREKLQNDRSGELDLEADDWVDAPADTLAGMFADGGIGLLNVHRRIRMVFGQQYGLQVESERGKGTKMIMTMPAEKT